MSPGEAALVKVMCMSPGEAPPVRVMCMSPGSTRSGVREAEGEGEAVGLADQRRRWFW